jgi:hypothetical protein
MRSIVHLLIETLADKAGSCMRMTLQVQMYEHQNSKQNNTSRIQHVSCRLLNTARFRLVCLTCGIPPAICCQLWLAACAAAIGAAAVRNVGTVLDDNRHLLLSAQTLAMAWCETDEQNVASVQQVQRSAKSVGPHAVSAPGTVPLRPMCKHEAVSR